MNNLPNFEVLKNQKSNTTINIGHSIKGAFAIHIGNAWDTVSLDKRRSDLDNGILHFASANNTFIEIIVLAIY